jgi:FHS family L-fucose permease-like MFS transporter
MTYVSIGLILLALWIIIFITKMPVAADESKVLDLKGTLKRLFSNKNYTMGVLAQFLYVGAQIGVWSFTIRYAMKELNLENIELPLGKTPEQVAAQYYVAALILFVASRFICTFLMKYIKPERLLTWAAILASVSSLFVIFGHGMVGVIALVSISAFMSLMFPTIFGIASKGLGEDTKIGSSGMIMAILGGAVITAIQGRVSDLSGSINIAYSVPLVCFLIIAFYGGFIRHQNKTSID